MAGRKCMATGKVSFATQVKARLVMLVLKWGYKRHKDGNGKRIKHRQGKPAQKRVYYCMHCGGYHLTRWTKGHFATYDEWLKNEIRGRGKNGIGDEGQIRRQ